MLVVLTRPCSLSPPPWLPAVLKPPPRLARPMVAPAPMTLDLDILYTVPRKIGSLMKNRGFFIKCIAMH